MTDSPEPTGVTDNGPTALHLMQAVPNPIVALNEQGRIVFANVAAENFFHLGAKVLLRMSLSDMVSGTSPLVGLAETVRRNRTSVNEYNLSIGTPRTGGERQVDLQVTAVPDCEGIVLLMITPRSIAQKIDRQLTHRDAVRTVAGMAAMMAHEIRNPLSGIRGAAQLLEPALSEEDAALAKLICSETDRIGALVDQMEVFCDERPIARSPVNIHEVLDHVITVSSSGFGQGRRIEQNYDPSLPPVVGNRDQLVQVFLNLLKNACEADPASGIMVSTAYRPGVHLSVAGSGERMSLPLEVCVSNTGDPISEDLLPHLFEPFVTTKANGKGLGLAMVAKIISDHSGMVECESNAERTTFRILLPRYLVSKDRRSSSEEMELVS
jgi:two-component system nitrogen regulation sensor histidine kinase GlnL